MKNQIEQNLKILNSLSVNTALWVFTKCFGDFYKTTSQTPLEQINNWVKSFHDQNIEQNWNRQKKMKYPHLFIYGMLWHYKYKTLNERRYQRESSEKVVVPNSKGDFDKHISVAEQITPYIMSLPFYDGVAFLGELIGAWMLTCPEVIIRSEKNVEYIGSWRVEKETTEWDVPITWIKQIHSDNAENLTADNEIILLYVLDFLLHFAFDDYDTVNTS